MRQGQFRRQEDVHLADGLTTLESGLDNSGPENRYVSAVAINDMIVRAAQLSAQGQNRYETDA